MKKDLCALALVVAGVVGGFAAVPAAAADGAKIGVVNMDRILRESQPAIAFQKRFEAKFSGRQKSLETAVKKFQEDAAAFQRAESTMRESERANRRRSLSERQRELDRRDRELREDANIYRNEELQRMIERGNQIIREIAQRDGYDLIVQEGVYFSPRIDITDRVLRAFNSNSSK